MLGSEKWILWGMRYVGVSFFFFLKNTLRRRNKCESHCSVWGWSLRRSHWNLLLNDLILLKQKTSDVPRNGVCLLIICSLIKKKTPGNKSGVTLLPSVHISLWYSTLLVLWNFPIFSVILMTENYFGEDGSGALSP